MGEHFPVNCSASLSRGIFPYFTFRWTPVLRKAEPFIVTYAEACVQCAFLSCRFEFVYGCLENFQGCAESGLDPWAPCTASCQNSDASTLTIHRSTNQLLHEAPLFYLYSFRTDKSSCFLRRVASQSLRRRGKTRVYDCPMSFRTRNANITNSFSPRMYFV